MLYSQLSKNTMMADAKPIPVTKSFLQDYDETEKFLTL